MRHRSTSLAAVLLLMALPAGCGDDDGGGPGGAPAPTTLDVPGDRDAAGARVVATAGCLACHKLGQSGNDGPGNDLTRIGAERSAAEIEEALLDPPRPMPSYRDLPSDERVALVEYLASLR